MSPKDEKYYKPNDLSNELKSSLKSIVDDFEQEEMSVRARQIRIWKKLEYYWSDFTRVWWDDTAHDWRLPDDVNNKQGENQAAYYDKNVNVFKAYLESIIAALSSTVPPVRFFPDDADNELDVSTARGASKIADLIYKHNDADLLWVKALYTYCTQGMIAAYQYTKEDDSYGTITSPKFDDVEQEIDLKFCPNCQAELNPDDLNLDDSLSNEFDPTGESDSTDEEVLCTACETKVKPELKKEKFIVQRLAGVTTEAKSRQCIEVFGGLFISVPNWARKQSEVPYLGYSYETHYVNVLEMYPWLREDMTVRDGQITGVGGVESYARWGRLSPQYYGEYPRSTPTVRNYWLRCSAFESEPDEQLRKELKKKFPNGAKVTWVNESFACAENESLDDHWTLTYNPLSEYLHFNPLGLALTSIQEMTQDLISLTLQTIEHGVPQVFADPSVLNFNQYRNSEIAPGSIVPAKNKTGKSLSEAFFMIQTATLSQEVQPFSEQIQQLGQFVSGAMPSIWGGDSGGSSRTAAQANMSRNQSLQRLQNTWKMLNDWWSNIFSKAVPAYIKYMKEDERIVRVEYGEYVNDWIKRSELEGKLGHIEPESSDQLPMTWGQTKDTIMQLMQTNNQEILAALGDPSNLGILQKAIGLDDFNLPGEHDREKQYYEINLLLKSSPLPGQMDPMTGQEGSPMPSIMPEFEVDNHQVEGAICRDWLVGEQGRYCKIQNEQGYANVLAHLKIHIQMNQQLQGVQSQSGQTPNSEQQDPSKLKPLNSQPQ